MPKVEIREAQEILNNPLIFNMSMPQEKKRTITRVRQYRLKELRKKKIIIFTQ